MADIQAGRGQGNMHARVSMIVNGSVRALTVEPRSTLLDALREEFGLGWS
jgi:aerobic-type carbon monoxide dehydrogenase small subunit (CoxS/CutS family)